MLEILIAVGGIHPASSLLLVLLILSRIKVAGPNQAFRSPVDGGGL